MSVMSMGVVNPAQKQRLLMSNRSSKSELWIPSPQVSASKIQIYISPQNEV